MSNPLWREPMRGSRRRMCEWIDKRPIDLESYLDGWRSFSEDRAQEQLEWLSPLRVDGYRELRDGLWARADLPRPTPQEDGFWPARGPQWDGVAIVRGSSGATGVLLVEAKSHVGELDSSASEAEGDRLVQIRAALDEVKEHLGVPPATEWAKRYYQIANRLAYLYYLRIRLGYPAWLLWVYFLGDGFGRPGHRVFPASKDEWTPSIRDAKAGLKLRDVHSLSQFTFEAFVPAELPRKDAAARG